ncbi:alpha-mannosidase mngB [Enterobacter cancerogenus]|uniref:Alpha-mannosidase mngB n=1 Tax=Enterobacter cancerogenus TaxID=69218 RepID=A0A484XV89_9ENTR|nr:alpha-mannosidase mngB [Enterobacter cancerogenus]
MHADPYHLENKIFPIVDLLRERAGIDNLLLPCGGDQVSIDPTLSRTLQTASERSPARDRYFLSSLEEYVESLRPQRERLEVWEGELKSPRYTRIHKTIGSVRYDIKKKNDEIEQFILRQLEPAIAIARHQGIPVNLGLVDTLWKKLLRCHAHDSMGGCNSDATNRDILHRLEQTWQLCHSLWNLVVKGLAMTSCDDGDLLIFNALPSRTSRVVKTTLYSRTDNIALTHQGKPLTFEVLTRETLPGGSVISLGSQGNVKRPCRLITAGTLRCWRRRCLPLATGPLPFKPTPQRLCRRARKRPARLKMKSVGWQSTPVRLRFTISATAGASPGCLASKTVRMPETVTTFRPCRRMNPPAAGTSP